MTIEIQKIQKQFNKVLTYSQHGIDEPQTDELFLTWFEKKQDIIKAFDGKLIYELDEKVQFELDESAKNERISSFIDDLWNEGYQELSDFIYSQKGSFFKNIVEKEYKYSDDIIVKKNTKIIKAFKYFIKDKEILDILQTKASRLIQENKVEGKLCFSVHPLDYLSISENNHNWRSCHALDGEYRAGNLSYMVDKSTIVCYLKSEEDVILPNFPDDVPWNNKKWRVLLYLSKDWNMIFAGKQYPFSTNGGMKLLTELFNKTRGWTAWTDYSFKKFENDINIEFNLNDTYIPLNDFFVELNQLVKDGNGSKHFNDVLRSSCYTPVYCYATYDTFWHSTPQIYANATTTSFEVGGMTKCVRCGKEEVVNCCDTMMCYDCDFKYGDSVNDTFCFCEHCGKRIEVENGYYVDQEMYCQDCYDKFTEKCECCGDSYPTESMVYDEVNDVYYCDWCRTNR
jgi:hypothetical protein